MPAEQVCTGLFPVGIRETPVEPPSFPVACCAAANLVIADHTTRVYLSESQLSVNIRGPDRHVKHSE